MRRSTDVKSKLKKLSICIVNFNSAEFIEISLYALSKLTKNSYDVFIIDNNSKKKDLKKLKDICSEYSNTHLETNKTNLRGSIAHGSALNRLVKKVKTPYFSILDADATWLIKDWDESLINKLKGKTKIIGSSHSGDSNKQTDFPAIFAILFETNTFKKLNIDLRPKQLPKQDTGYELRKKYLKAGFNGKTLQNKNTRYYKKGPFSKILCTEFYSDDTPKIFASHFGRGATLGKEKYLRNWRIFYKTPFVGKKLLSSRGKKEKRHWIKICKHIVDKQEKGFEQTVCDFCQSKKYKEILSAPDHYNKLPGEFFIVQCEQCSLIYTNPRPTPERLNYFYPETAGYYQPEISKKKNNFKMFIKKSLLKEYYQYWPGEKRSIFMKVLLFPIYLLSRSYFKSSGIPSVIKNGEFLDIGCSYGNQTYQMKQLGWKVTGVEMNKNAVKYGRKKLDLNIQNKDIESFDTQKKFDVVNMSMVLEHVFSPKTTLKKAHKLLKKNGNLIITIPDFNGFERKLYKKYAYTLQLPTHMTHFTPQTIKRFLNLTGFKKIKIYHQSVDRDFIAPLVYMKRSGKNTGLLLSLMNNFLIRRLLIKPFIKIMSILGKTSRMTIYATKND